MKACCSQGEDLSHLGPKPGVPACHSPRPGKLGPLSHHGEAQLLFLLCGFWKGYGRNRPGSGSGGFWREPKGPLC